MAAMEVGDEEIIQLLLSIPNIIHNIVKSGYHIDNYSNSQREWQEKSELYIAVEKGNVVQVSVELFLNITFFNMIRPIDQLEKAFFNPITQNDIYFSIKFTEKKYTAKATENLIKLFSGLRLNKITRYRIKNVYKKEMNSAVHKLPNWIQDCQKASIWAEDNIYTPNSESLANIAANDRIVVLRSSHVITDGGFITEAIKHVLDDMSTQPPNSDPPYTMKEAFQQEINDSIQYNSTHPNPNPSLPITTYRYDCDSPFLAPTGTRKVESDYDIHSYDLICYDKKPKN